MGVGLWIQGMALGVCFSLIPANTRERDGDLARLPARSISLLPGTSLRCHSNSPPRPLDQPMTVGPSEVMLRPRSSLAESWPTAVRDTAGTWVPGARWDWSTVSRFAPLSIPSSFAFFCTLGLSLSVPVIASHLGASTWPRLSALGQGLSPPQGLCV